MISLRILLVDDAPVMRQRLADAIRASGVAVEDILVASDAAQALGLLDVFLVDVVIIEMPKTDGVQLAADIARRPELSRVKVIVIAAEQHEFRAALLGRLGVHACPIRPPFVELQAHLLEASQAAPAARRPRVP